MERLTGVAEKGYCPRVFQQRIWKRNSDMSEGLLVLGGDEKTIGGRGH